MPGESRKMIELLTLVLIPRNLATLSELRTSSLFCEPWICVFPLLKSPNKIALCEIDLSPGITISPETVMALYYYVKYPTGINFTTSAPCSSYASQKWTDPEVRPVMCAADHLWSSSSVTWCGGGNQPADGRKHTLQAKYEPAIIVTLLVWSYCLLVSSWWRLLLLLLLHNCNLVLPSLFAVYGLTESSGITISAVDVKSKHMCNPKHLGSIGLVSPTFEAKVV